MHGALRGQGWLGARQRRPTSSGCGSATRTDEFAAACADAGVVVRPFAGEGIRVTIGEAEASDLFLEVAARFAPSAGRDGQPGEWPGGSSGGRQTSAGGVSRSPRITRTTPATTIPPPTNVHPVTGSESTSAPRATATTGLT